MASLGEGGTKVGPAYFRSACVKKLDSANHVMAMELEPAWDILIPEVDDLNPICSNRLLTTPDSIQLASSGLSKETTGGEFRVYTASTRGPIRYI